MREEDKVIPRDYSWWRKTPPFWVRWYRRWWIKRHNAEVMEMLDGMGFQDFAEKKITENKR